MQSRVVYTHLADETHIWHQPSACGCCINDSSCDCYSSQESKRQGHLQKGSKRQGHLQKGNRRKWFGALREVSHHGNKAEIQTVGDQKEGQEDQLRSEGRNLGQSIGNSGI